MKKIIGYILAIVMVVSIVPTINATARNFGGGGGGASSLNATEYSGNINGSQIDEKSGFDVGKTGGIAPLGGTAGSKTVTPKSLALNEDGVISEYFGAIYAMGNEITLTDGKTPGTTKVFVGKSTTPYPITSASGSVEDGYDLSGYTIYGDGGPGDTANVLINIKGGTILAVWVGSGGFGYTVIDATVNISGGTITECCLGTGYEGFVTNSTFNISGGTITGNLNDNQARNIPDPDLANTEYPTADNKTINIWGNPKIGTDGATAADDRGIIINGGTKNIGASKLGTINGMDTVNIVGELGPDAEIHLVLPEGYNCTAGGTIALGNVKPGESTTYTIKRDDNDAILLVGDGTSKTGGNVIDFYATKLSSGNKLVTGDGFRVDKDNSQIYANGKGIRLEAGSTADKTNVFIGTSSTACDLGIVGSSIADGFDLSGYTVWGGGKTALTGDTKITMTGGKVNEIYGGSERTDLIGSTDISISDNASITSVFGGGMYGSVKDTKISITGGNIDGIYCGSYNGNANITTVTISDGTIRSVYGGGWSGSVAAATVNIKGGTITEEVYGGGNWGDVTTATVYITGGTIANVYGGADSKTVNIANITISNGTITGNVCGGGFSPDGNVGTANITISNGTIANVYGGGEFNSRVTNANITISNGTIAGNVYGGGYDNATVTNPTTLNISGNPKIGTKGVTAAEDKGIIINDIAGTTVTDGIPSFNIVGALTGDAKIHVVLPEGYTTGTIANAGDDTATPGAKYKIIEGDKLKLKVIGTSFDPKRFSAKLSDDFLTINIVEEPTITPPSGGGSGSGDTTRFYGVSDTTGNGVTPKNEDGKYTYAVDGGKFVLDNIGGMQGGKTYSITVNPNEGYVLDYITINGEKTTNLTFTMPMASLDIQVVFKQGTTVVPTPTPSEKPTPGVQADFPWWIVILVGAIVLLIIIVAITKKKKDNEEKHNGGNGNGNGNGANQNENDNDLK